MFDREIKALEDLARWADREGARTCATAIGSTAKGEYQAGQSPAGAKWAPRKKDGAPALQRAPEHVTFYGEGEGIYQEFPDHYNYHGTGTRYMVKRSVFVETKSRLPAAWQAAAEKALETRMKGFEDAIRS